MSKFFLYLATSVLLVAFGFSNTEHVNLSFVFGAPVQVRLIFLLLLTFLAGAAMPVFLILFNNARRRRHEQPALASRREDVVHEP